MMFGQSRDVLVLKFIEKLRTAVQNRKDTTAQKASTEFIRNILKKKNFNDQFKVMKQVKKKSTQIPLIELKKKHEHERKEKEKVQKAIFEMMGGEVSKNAIEID